MTKAEIKDYLSKSRLLNKEIALTESRIKEYDKQNEKDSAFYSDLGLDIEISSSELIAELKDSIKKYRKFLSDVQQLINQLDDPKQRFVLSRYFVESSSVDIIALDLYGFSTQYIYKIMQQAIAELAEINKEN